MTALEDWNERGPRRFVKPAIVVGVVVLVGAAIWYAAHDQSSIKRTAPPPTLIAVMPPPPPPPPTPPKPAEPEKTIETPSPQPDQAKTPDQPRQITINGPAQAGGDQFGVGAGSGGGSVAIGGTTDGTGAGNAFGRAAYKRYLASFLQRLVDRDSRVSKFVGSAEVEIWADPSGRITRAAIAQSSGDAKVDAAVIEDFNGASLDEPPPSDVKFPARLTVNGRRRG